MPFGLPPGVARVSLAPSGFTRVMQPPINSTTSTSPFGKATGPSGNRNPEVISVISGIDMPRPFPVNTRQVKMCLMRIRLEPQDEYMHPLETASNFNESMYFNV